MKKVSALPVAFAIAIGGAMAPITPAAAHGPVRYVTFTTPTWTRGWRSGATSIIATIISSILAASRASTTPIITIAEVRRAGAEPSARSATGATPRRSPAPRPEPEPAPAQAGEGAAISAFHPR